MGIGPLAGPPVWLDEPPRQRGQMSDGQFMIVAQLNLEADRYFRINPERSANARIVKAPGSSSFLRRYRSKGSLRAWRFDRERPHGLYLLLDCSRGDLYVSDRHVGSGVFADCLRLWDFVCQHDPAPARLQMLLDELKLTTRGA
jgi:hypothetical protein